MAAWKRTRSRVAGRTASARAKAQTRDVKFEADDQSARLAIDAGREQPTDTLGQVAAEPKPTRPDATPPDDEGDYTSRLLAAKRRARGDDTSSESSWSYRHNENNPSIDRGLKSPSRKRARRSAGKPYLSP